MKWLLCIWCMLFIQPVFSQPDPAALAKELTASCKTDLEKVKNIFRWITENISYKTSVRQKKITVSSINDSDRPEDTSALKPLDERVAEVVLQRKTAYCDGYARLFTTLCGYAGIRSELVSGYASNSIDRPGRRFGVNHYWNAVFIDSAWHLLDVTWASGYLNWQGDEFIRQYDERYFLTPPEVFIRDHYPDDLQWTLLPDPQTPKEFHNSPFKQKSFVKYSITSYYPASGMVAASVGDTIRFELEIAEGERDKDVCPDLLVDPAIFSRSASCVFLKPLIADSLQLDPNRLQYMYPVTSPDLEWLYILYNDDMVLRYKINVRKEKETAAN
jgi:Transglutaminase-like superfamily